jgi:hypothetical protein
MTKSPKARWDPPAHLTVSERQFLEQTADNILAIQEKAALSIGLQLLAIKRRFHRDPSLGKWFTRWIKEKTCLTLNQATVWLKIAEESEKDDRVKELVEECKSETIIYRTLLLPKDYKEAILESLLNGNSVTQDEIEQLAESPFVKIDKLEDIVYQLHAEVAEITHAQLEAATPKERSAYAAKKRGAEGRLERALADLAIARKEARDAKEQGQSKQEEISFLKREVRHKRLYIEQLTKDPDAEERRMMSKAVVDMAQSTKALMEAFALFEAIKDKMPVDQKREIYRLIDHTYDTFRQTSER